MTIPPLPKGVSQFLGPNGAVLAGGSVFNSIPKTTALKQTWNSPTQATANSNPIVLDSTGSAIIYGFGAYRQLVLDSSGVTISDSLTFGGQLNKTTVVLNTPDSGNFIVPSGVYVLYVEVVGAGAGGANCIAAASRSGVSAGGGGAGGFASGLYAVVPGQAIYYTVGAGGTSGMIGGITAFGLFLSGTGGHAGVATSTAISLGGAGGSATGGTIRNQTGGSGTDGCHLPSGGTTVYQGAGNGGTSAYGPGGTSTNGASGNAGVAPGSGGAGPMDVNLTNILFPGGVGADGQIIISYWS